MMKKEEKNIISMSYNLCVFDTIKIPADSTDVDYRLRKPISQ